MYVPRLGAFATTPVGVDAAVVMSAHVAPEYRGKGIGKQLIQSAAGLVARRDIRALEAVGTYHAGPSCMLPVGWLEAVGFEVVRPHRTPRLGWTCRTPRGGGLVWAPPGTASPTWCVSRNLPSRRPTLGGKLASTPHRRVSSRCLQVVDPTDSGRVGA